MKSLLQVSDLVFRYASGAFALDHLSLEMRAGEKVALVGANGSGKSTLLLHVAGCLAPGSGSVRLEDELVTGNPRKAGGRLGLLFQNPDFQLLMPSVREELLLALQGADGDSDSRSRRVEALADELGFSTLLDCPPHRLSAGQKQLVALGTLLITRPSLLLLDEPTAALDPRTRRALIRFLCGLRTGMLVATHDLDMALDVVDRVIILRRGKVVADGPVRELLSDPRLLSENHLELPLCLQHPDWR